MSVGHSLGSFWRSFSLAVVAALAAVAALAVPAAGIVVSPPGSAEEPAEELTPVLASVLAKPAAVPQSDGVWRLPYELELVNVTDVPMTLESLEVRDPSAAGAVIRTFTAAELAVDLSVPGGAKTGTLAPGQGALLYVNLEFPNQASVPARIANRLTVTTPQPKGPLQARTVENVAETDVTRDAPIVLAPPLRGERWVAAASCCKSYHRRAALPVNGERHLAQRYAIDWMQLDAQDRMATGDPKRNESFPQFGAEALAVADATVVFARDGLPEGTPGSFPGSVAIETADGNSIVLDLGGGRYALYAHLQPGSLRVAKGDRVQRGQILGLVGNTGNSDAPHLHFHVMDSPSPLASNGLPYVIDAFEVTGTAVSSSDLDDELKSGVVVPVQPVAGSPRRTNELPADLAIVTFGK
jgi:hypothetical protein